MQEHNNFLGKFIGQHSEIGARFLLETYFNTCSETYKLTHTWTRVGYNCYNTKRMKTIEKPHLDAGHCH